MGVGNRPLFQKNMKKVLTNKQKYGIITIVNKKGIDKNESMGSKI